jgi:tetratricopeptide (TPR) repeat protein
MSEEKIEQQVVISDQAQIHGDVTLVGKIVNVVKHPAQWQDAILNFIFAHRYFFLAALVLQVGLFALYLLHMNLYLIPLWLWGLAATLLLSGCWLWYSNIRLTRTRIRLVVSIASTLAFCSIIGAQAKKVVLPQQFAPSVFGIALAELSEGPNFERTSTTREITDQVYELLCSITESSIAANGTEAPCANISDLSDSREVAIQRVGVIPDSKTAKTYGQKIGADLVIWGQILTSSQGSITIRFQIIETLDKVGNPDFPVVLPVTTTATEIYANTSELNLESDSLMVSEIKEAVIEKSTAISSFILGVIAYHNQDFLRARELLEIAIQTIEKSGFEQTSPKGLSIPYYYLGKANHFLGGIETGQIWLKKAQDANSDEPAVPLSLAYGYRSLGEADKFQDSLDRAFELVNIALDQNPNNLFAIYDRGIIYELREEPDFAILDYKAVIEQDDDFFIAWINLGNAALKTQDFETAESAAQQALDLAQKINANTAAPYFLLARVWQQTNKLNDADEAYQAATTSASQGNVFYHQQYAQFLEDQGNYDKALQIYQDAIDNAIYKSGVYRATGNFLRRRGRLDEALGYYQEAVQQNYQDLLARTSMAEVYYQLGDVEHALELYRQIVEDNTTSYYPYSSYAITLYQQGQYEEAIDMLKESLARRPFGPEELRNLAEIYIFLGRCAEAREVLEEILANREDLPEDLIHYAEDGLQNRITC